jgi:DNA-binding NarL/FixJ family response regulator
MRVVVAEDNTLLRDGLTHLIERRGHRVLAAVGDADALLAAVRAEPPDVAVIDVRMPPTHTDEGMRAALTLRRDHPAVAVLVLAQYVETHYATRLLAGPAQGVGYLLKDRVADVSDFVDALHRVAAGGVVLDPEVVSQVVGASRQTAGLAGLTERERQVLHLMAEGRSNTAIAEALHVSYASVEKYVTSIFGKLLLAPSPADHRRVLAVVTYLRSA